MSSTLKIGLILALATAFFVSFSHFWLNAVVKTPFETLEKEFAARNVDMIRQAIRSDLAAVAAFNDEYAPWDETYAFVQGQRQDYVDRNIAKEEVLISQDIDVLAFFDRDGKLYWGAAHTNQSIGPLAQDSLFRADQPVWSLTVGPDAPQSGILGLMDTPLGPLMMAARPILTTDLKGPRMGTLITGRFLDETTARIITDKTKVYFEAYRAPDPSTSNLASLGQVVGETSRINYVALKDVAGREAIVLEIHSTRKISSLGASTVRSSAMMLTVAGLSFGLIVWVLMRKTFLSPIATLTEHIVGIRDSGDLSKRVFLGRKDEIGTLASHFDGLTEELDSAHAEMEQSRDDALEVSRLKGQFLASMSHEIRTPMNGIIGMSELLATTSLDSKQKQFTDTLANSARSLLGIINDILDFSKIEAGKLDFECLDFDLRQMIVGVVDMFEHTARSKNIELNCLVTEDEDWYCQGDPNRLRQVLVNLVSNAIKFTEEGAVIVRASIYSQSDEDARLIRIHVQDSGIGIPEEKQRDVFESFSQADLSTTREYGGTGLGLSISQQLIDMMGGSLHLHSVEGKGSTFSITIPMPRGVERPEITLSADNTVTEQLQNLRGARVLLVEDNEVNQLVAKEMIDRFNIGLDIACNGQEALDALKSKSFDLILMDCQMPVMDGYEATAAIRRIEDQDEVPRIPIVAMTASAMVEDRQRCLEAGMDDYLPKPFDRDQLEQVIGQWVRESA